MQIEQVKQILTRDFPQMQIDSLKELEHGWKNFVFLINNKLIVRFPKTIHNNLRHQQAILTALSNKISYRLPSIHYINTQSCYAVYPAILACSYNRYDFEQFTDQEQQNVAQDLADFLKQLHEAYPLTEVEKMKIERFNYTQEIIDIKNESKVFDNFKLPQNIRTFVQDQAEIATFHLTQTYDEVLLHNDLHCKNIILDCDTKHLNGVIDFDDIKIGHYHLDFAGFCLSLPQSLVAQIAQKYEQITGRKVLLDYAGAVAVDYLSSSMVKHPQKNSSWQEALDTLEYLRT